MKTLLIIALIATALPAWARIGETLPQLEARYGKQGTPFQGDPTFTKDGLHICALMHEGKCVRLMFLKEEGKLTEAEVKILLEANAGGKTWQQRHLREWVTTDASRDAMSSDQGLSITDVQGYQKREDAKANKEASKLKGF